MGNIEQQVAPVSTPQVVPVVDQALSKKTQFLWELDDAKNSGKITLEQFNNAKWKIETIFIKQDQEMNAKIKEMSEEKNKILKESAKKRMEWGTESLAMESLKSALYFPLGIDKDLSKNNPTQNFTKWVMDEALALPEVVALLLPPNSQLPAFIEWIKNMSWADVRNTFFHGVTDIWSGEAYKAGRSAVFTILLLTGVGWALKSGSSLATKVAGAQILKAGTKTWAKEVVKNIAKATVRKPIEFTAGVLNKVGTGAMMPWKVIGKWVWKVGELAWKGISKMKRAPKVISTPTSPLKGPAVSMESPVIKLSVAWEKEFWAIYTKSLQKAQDILAGWKRLHTTQEDVLSYALKRAVSDWKKVTNDNVDFIIHELTRFKNWFTEDQAKLLIKKGVLWKDVTTLNKKVWTKIKDQGRLMQATSEQISKMKWLQKSARFVAEHKGVALGTGTVLWGTILRSKREGAANDYDLASIDPEIIPTPVPVESQETTPPVTPPEGQSGTPVPSPEWGAPEKWESQEESTEPVQSTWKPRKKSSEWTLEPKGKEWAHAPLTPEQIKEGAVGTVATKTWKLNVRDENGRVIWKLNKWEQVTLTGESKDINGRKYVKVKSSDGKEWFVAADFIKVDKWADKVDVQKEGQKVWKVDQKKEDSIPAKSQKTEQTSPVIGELSAEKQEKLKAGKPVELAKYTITQMKADWRDWYSDDSWMKEKKEIPTETYDNTFELYLKDGQYVLEMNGTWAFTDTTEPMGKDVPSPQVLQKKMEEMMSAMQKNWRETFAITHPELYTVAFNLAK